MSDRAIVTGATGGIGEAVVRRLAATGAEVVLVGRDAERLERAVARISAEQPDARLVRERADLSLLAEVRDLGERLVAGPPAQIVVSNAAVIAPLDDVTSEGLPRTVVTNHLAPYLLLRTLAGSIGRHGARFVVVGGDPAGLARVPVDVDDPTSVDGDPALPAVLHPVELYARTKNMNAMFVYALADRLDPARVTVNGAHPGIIGGTGLGEEVPESTAAFAEALRLEPEASRPGPEHGADTPAWLATAAEVATVSGRFFVDRTSVETAAHTTDPARVERLWERSAQLVGLPV